MTNPTGETPVRHLNPTWECEPERDEGDILQDAVWRILVVASDTLTKSTLRRDDPVAKAFVVGIETAIKAIHGE